MPTSVSDILINANNYAPFSKLLLYLFAMEFAEMLRPGGKAFVGLMFIWHEIIGFRFRRPQRHISERQQAIDRCQRDMARARARYAGSKDSVPRSPSEVDAPAADNAGN